MRVLIRADAGPAIGAGHVMRMLALADALADRGDAVRLLSAPLGPALTELVRARGVDLAVAAVEAGGQGDLAWVLAEAAAWGADWVAADGYRFGAAWQDRVVAAGVRLLVHDDDGHADRWPAHLVLSPHLASREERFTRAARTRLLLGPRYVLLRRELLAAPPPRPAPARADRVLVTLGGADPTDATPRVLEGLRSLADPALRVRALVGPSNPRAAALAAALDDPRVELLGPTRDMPALLAWADLAVAGAGGTAYELAWTGVPALLVVLADNQEVVGPPLDAAGAAVCLGRAEALSAAAVARAVDALRGDRARREALAARGRALVDGGGARRVAAALHAWPEVPYNA